MKVKKSSFWEHHRWLQIFLAIAGIALIVNLAKDTLRLLRSSQQLKTAAQEVEKLEKETLSLIEKKEYYRSDEFIEEEARNKLNMVKEGEVVVILPPNVKEILGEVEAKIEAPLPYWRQWLNLFL